MLYYGDELGLAGANDPDFASRDAGHPATQPGLSPQQAAVLNHAQTLARLRRCLPQLRRGYASRCIAPLTSRSPATALP